MNPDPFTPLTEAEFAELNHCTFTGCLTAKQCMSVRWSRHYSPRLGETNCVPVAVARSSSSAAGRGCGPLILLPLDMRFRS